MINLADIIILGLALLAAYIGVQRGTIRQLGGLLGVVIGIFVAAFIYDKLAFLSRDSTIRTLVLAAVLIGAVFLLFDLCVFISGRLQKKVALQKFVGSLPDKIGGAIVSAVGSIFLIWLVVLIFDVVMPQVVRAQLESSYILTSVAEHSTVPASINNVSQLLKPFSSPDVFVGPEPSFIADPSVDQAFQELDMAIVDATPAIVKVSTWGCGSVGVGSGFMIGKRHIVTNAHVIAGSDRISIASAGNNYVGQVVLFDPGLDVAVLLTESDLPAKPLEASTTSLSPGSIAAVLGYPRGGDFLAGDAIVLQRLNAGGYDIYRQNKVVRSVYALRGDVVPGNSGGPVINSKGQVIGLVFGHSTSQNKIGYAITTDQIGTTIQNAHDLRTVVSSGSCAAG